MNFKIFILGLGLLNFTVTAMESNQSEHQPAAERQIPLTGSLPHTDLTTIITSLNTSTPLAQAAADLQHLVNQPYLSYPLDSEKG